MPGTNQSLWRQGKNLLTHRLPCHFPGLVAAPNGAGKLRVTDSRYVRVILRPGADNVGSAIFRMSRRAAVGDSQTAKVNKIIGAVALVDRSILCAAVNPGLGKLLT